MAKKQEPKPEEPKQEKPKDELLTVYEAAEYFKTNENTIKLWLQHGHLTEIRHGLIPMTSILHCRFNIRR